MHQHLQHLPLSLSPCWQEKTRDSPSLPPSFPPSLLLSRREDKDSGLVFKGPDRTGPKILCAKTPIVMGNFNGNALAQKTSKKGKNRTLKHYSLLLSLPFSLLTREDESLPPSFPPSLLLPSFPPPSLLLSRQEDEDSGCVKTHPETPSSSPSLLPSFPPSLLLPSFSPSLLPSFPPSLPPSSLPTRRRGTLSRASLLLSRQEDEGLRTRQNASQASLLPSLPSSLLIRGQGMRDTSKRILRNEHKQERGLEMGGARDAASRAPSVFIFLLVCFFSYIFKF